jgi:DNA invertase Pin-like site-specific DNA recombinase
MERASRRSSCIAVARLSAAQPGEDDLDEGRAEDPDEIGGGPRGASREFSKLVKVFDRNGVTFVSVTQSFNTTTSMGRLTLNILLSFAQFEREVIGERIRDKVAASRKRGIWMGGYVPVGYDVQDRKLV